MTEMTDRDPMNGRFLTGNNGGPGRPKGSRSKLAEVFFADLCENWRRHGPSVLEQMREENPVAYVAMVARLMPTKLEATDPLREISDEDLSAMIEELNALIAMKSSAA